MQQMFIFVELGYLVRKSLNPHGQLDHSQRSSCQRQAGACACLNMCSNLKTHKLDVVSAVPVASMVHCTQIIMLCIDFMH